MSKLRPKVVTQVTNGRAWIRGHSTSLVWPISCFTPVTESSWQADTQSYYSPVCPLADRQKRGMLLHCLLIESTAVQNWLLITPQFRYFIPTQFPFSTEMMNDRLSYLFSRSNITYTVTHHITTFQSMTDHIYDSRPQIIIMELKSSYCLVMSWWCWCKQTYCTASHINAWHIQYVQHIIFNNDNKRLLLVYLLIILILVCTLLIKSLL